MKVFRAVMALGWGLLVSACGGDTASDTGSGLFALDLTDVGFATPESVLHDPIADVYLVSNISGDPFAKDDDGFISRITPDGQIENLRWIDGAAGAFELNAPKGMAFRGDSLYVTDIDCVRIFHRNSGAPLGQSCLQDADFLNDIAVDGNGTVYFTDSGFAPGFEPSGADAIYRFTPGERISTLARDEELGGPNGISFGDRGGFVVTFRTGEIYQLTPTGDRVTVLPGSPSRQLDGIVFTPDGGFLFSNWADQTVRQTTPEGQVRIVVEGVESPADIGFDAERHRVLIPLFNADAVWIREIEVAAPDTMGAAGGAGTG